MALVIALALVATRPVVSARPVAPVAPVAPVTDDVRGLWVLRSSLSSARNIQQMVATATRAGFNTVFVQVRGRGDAYYDSRVEPRATELADEPAAFDPLAVTLASAHAAGLKVHAWFNVDLVASATTLPRAGAHVIARHPEWVMVPRSLASTPRSEPTETPAHPGHNPRSPPSQKRAGRSPLPSPVLPASRAYTASVVADLVSRYPIDGMHFDYLRYPNERFDYSVSTTAAFRAEVVNTVTRESRDRIDQLARTNAAAWPDALPDAWADFRRDRLTTLASTLRTTALAARPGITISAAVAPNADEARDGRLQDWRQWAKDGIIDVVCPMIYTPDAPEVAASIPPVKR